MAIDDQILADILRREGSEYTDLPGDAGGPTKYGITLLTLFHWRGKPVTPADVAALTEAEARDMYRALYLTPVRGQLGDAAYASIGPQVVDIAVNAGLRRAFQLLDRAHHNQLRNGQSLNTALAIERLRYYAGIVKVNPVQARFLLGWVNRACEFLRG